MESILQAKSKIENSFNEYENLQAQHLEILKSDQIPDLEGMNNERNEVFRLLKASLEIAMGSAVQDRGKKNSIHLLKKYEIRLNRIIQLDDKISIEIKKYQDLLKSSLNRIKKGKNAMNGYKKAGVNPSNPCVLSMNS